MQKKIFIHVLLFVFILNLVPIHSNASASSLLDNNTTEFIDTGVIQPQSVDTYISWKLASDASKTKDVYLSKNATISISVVLSSSSATARVGIIDPDGTYYVKSITGNGSYSFKAPSSGTYQIYCKNTSSVTYTAAINYSIQ